MEVEGNNLKRKFNTDDDVSDGCPEKNTDNSMETNALAEEHVEADDETDDHLRQFDVLDEVQGDDSGSENGDNDHKGSTIIDDLIFTFEFQFLLLSSSYRNRLKRLRCRRN